jgi:Peptidase family M48
MFYALAIVLCLAVLFLVMAVASAFCAAGLWTVRRHLGSMMPRVAANLLFFMRVLPVLAGVLVAWGLALPAFLRFEPRYTKEMMSGRLLALGTVGAALVMVIGARAFRVLWATARARNEWRTRAERLELPGIDVPIYCADYCADGPVPLLAMTGTFQPEIFVSRQVMRKLSRGELAAALAHEMAHATSWDNFKRTLLKITQPPKWLGFVAETDAAWLNASEIAADEGALARGASVLDLSSALVKVARMNGKMPVRMVTASHLLPQSGASSIEMRISHLHRLLENEREAHTATQHGISGKYRVGLSLAVLVLCYVGCLVVILPWVHETLELLVK